MKSFNNNNPYVTSLIAALSYTIYTTSIVISVLLMAHLEFFANTMDLWVVGKAFALFVLSTFMIIFGLFLRSNKKSAELIHFMGILLIGIAWLHTSIVHF